MSFAEGTMVRGTGSEIYVIEAGRRRRIPDPATFMGRGYRWEDVRIIADQELRALPLGAPLPSLILPYAEKQDSLGNDQYMATNVSLIPAMHRIEAVTQTWTRNFWLGFTGAVLVLLVDEAGNVVGDTGVQTFDVDGLIVVAGPSARTDYWHKEIPPALVARTTSLAILHKTAPENRRAEIFAQVEQIVHEAAQTARAVGPVMIELAAIVA